MFSSSSVTMMDNSAPKLPDTSMGSSVDTDMENEYNDLLRYTLILPASFEPPTQGPKILENIKGLFSTKSIPAIKPTHVEKAKPHEQRMVSSTENDFEFIRTTESVENNDNKSLDLINFDQSVIDGLPSTSKTEPLNTINSMTQEEETHQLLFRRSETTDASSLQDNSVSHISSTAESHDIELIEEKCNNNDEHILKVNNLITANKQQQNKLEEELVNESVVQIETINNSSNSRLDLTVSNNLNLNTSSELITAVQVAETNNESDRQFLANTSDEHNEHAGKTTLNSLTIISELNNLSVTRRQSTSLVEHYKTPNNPAEDKNMNNSSPSLSPSSPTSTASSSPYSANNDSEIIQHLFSNFNNSNDINPRKNSPVPASPPSNVEVDPNVSASLEHVQSSNSNYHQQSVVYRGGSKTAHNDSHKHQLNRIVSETSSQNEEYSNHYPDHYIRQNYQSSNDEIGPPAGGSKSAGKNVKIASCMDKWYKELKGQVLSEFEKSRVQLLQEQQRKLIEEKEKQTAEIIKLKKELDMSRESIKVYEKNIVRKDEAIENLSKAFEKQREKTDLLRVMMEWKLKRQENAKEAFSDTLAAKYYNMRVKLRAFLCWQQFIIGRRKTKLEKACKKKAEEVCYELATKYETKIKTLEEELTYCKQEIEKYKVEMTKNEENLKKALMRGVCALNMEAMSIFSDSNSKTNEKPLINLATENNMMPNSYSEPQSLYHHPQLSQTTNNLLKSMSSTSSHMANANSGNEHHHSAHYQPSYYPNSASMYTSTNFSSKYKSSGGSEAKDLADRHHQCKLSERESKDLSKKVKSYCETSLKRSTLNAEGCASAALLASNENLSALDSLAAKHHSSASGRNSGSMSALSRAKMQLLNSHQEQQQQQQQQHQSYTNLNSEPTLSEYASRLASNRRGYDELIEHPLPPQNKSTTKYSNIKAKVGSLPTSHSSYSTVNSTKHLHSSTTAANCQQHHHTTCSKYIPNNASTAGASAQPPYRSVLIEKHTPGGGIAEKTTTTQIKFAMPMQSAKVLNKVVTTPMHY